MVAVVVGAVIAVVAVVVGAVMSVVAVVVVKVTVRSVNIVVVVEMVVIDVRVDVVIATLFGVEILVGSDIVIALELVASTSYFVYVLSDVVVDALTRVIMGFVSGIGVEVLTGANATIFASLMTILEFTVSIPLGEFGCRAAFDSRPLALCD